MWRHDTKPTASTKGSSYIRQHFKNLFPKQKAEENRQVELLQKILQRQQAAERHWVNKLDTIQRHITNLTHEIQDIKFINVYLDSKRSSRLNSEQFARPSEAMRH